MRLQTNSSGPFLVKACKIRPYVITLRSMLIIYEKISKIW